MVRVVVLIDLSAVVRSAAGSRLRLVPGVGQFVLYLNYNYQTHHSKPCLSILLSVLFLVFLTYYAAA